jgi:hypothetical protein
LPGAALPAIAPEVAAPPVVQLISKAANDVQNTAQQLAYAAVVSRSAAALTCILSSPTHACLLQAHAHCVSKELD